MRKYTTKSQDETETFGVGKSPKDKPPRYDRRNNFDGVKDDPDINPKPDLDTRYNYRDAAVCLLSRDLDLSDTDILKWSDMMSQHGEKRVSSMLKRIAASKKSTVTSTTGVMPHDPNNPLFVKMPVLSKTPADLAHNDLIQISNAAVGFIDPLIVSYDIDMALRVALDYAIHDNGWGGQIDAVVYDEMLNLLIKRYDSKERLLMENTKMTDAQKLAYVAKLDKFASDVEANYTRMNLSKRDALRLAYRLDTLSDRIEKSATILSGDTHGFMQNFNETGVLVNGAGTGQGTGLMEFNGSPNRPSNESGDSVQPALSPLKRRSEYVPVTEEGVKMARSFGRTGRRA